MTANVNVVCGSRCISVGCLIVVQTAISINAQIDR